MSRWDALFLWLACVFVSLECAAKALGDESMAWRVFDAVAAYVWLFNIGAPAWRIWRAR
jgi:hypothetical protein